MGKNEWAPWAILNGRVHLEVDGVKRSDQDAVSPTISVMLLVLLTAIIAIIIYAFIYGIPGGLEKSAFIAAEAGVVEINGTEYVAIQHRGGDEVFLNGSGAARGIPIDIRTTAAGGGPVLAGADAPITWKAGQVLYLYNSPSGPKITIDRLTAAEGTGFPAGELELVIIDTNAEVRVFGSTLAMAGSGPGPDDPPVAGFTVEAWVKWNREPEPELPDEDDRRWATITVDGTSDNNARYHLQHVRTNRAFEFAARNNQQREWISGTTAPQQGEWYYVAGVYEADFGDHGRILIYVNGNSEGSSQFTSGERELKATTGTIQTGGPAGIEWPGPTSMQRKFDGEIRGLNTYERAFTQAEIQARYDAGVP